MSAIEIAPATVPGRTLPDDRSWTIEETAYFLGVCESTVRNLERAGKLPALQRIGTRVPFDPTVVKAYRVGGREAAAKAMELLKKRDLPKGVR